MAKNLMNKGHELNVLDINPENCKEVASLGAKVSKVPAEVAADSDFIITMLPAHPQVMHVFTAKDGILSWVLILLNSQLKPGKLTWHLPVKFD